MVSFSKLRQPKSPEETFTTSNMRLSDTSALDIPIFAPISTIDSTNKLF